MENTGIKLSCLYALPPHLKGYCGPKDKKNSSLILDFVEGKRIEESEIKKIFIKNFPVVIGYYKIISEEHNLELFDEKVVRAYWTGNDLLDDFFKAGKFIPFHLYHVLTSDLSDEDIKSCQISWKKVKDDNIATHWGKAIEILTDSEIKQLKKYNQLIFDFYNQKK